MKKALGIILLPLLGGCAFFVGKVPGLPVTVTYVKPVTVTTNLNGRIVVDFGREAFGWLELLPPPGFAGGMQQVVIGEKLDVDGGIDRWAPGNVIFRWTFPEEMPEGSAPYRVDYPPDERNTKYTGATPAIRLPDEIGTVHPFRYAEFFVTPFPITAASVRQAMVHYPMDMRESSFSCSDARLERVYELCKYSILATSFAGLYVDGDRERIPYEADAYLNQLGHYAISSDRALARRTHEYLLEHPTWPTEWKQHSIRIAWADWMWAGDTGTVARAYGRLRDEKLLLDRARPDGLVRSALPILTEPGGDLIDWPPRDRDGYVFTEASAVINAFHYRNLLEMADLAEAIGRPDDVADFRRRAARAKESYNRVFFSADRGLYRDGEGTEHCGFHANALALAFGLVPEERRGRIADWLIGRGLPCSVYFAQYLLEALYAAGRDREAMALMTADTNRSWLGMLREGATITMEAWNVYDKPNLDWNHAWGTAPLNVISRYVLGVTPEAPGFERARIAPRPSGLAEVRGTVPTQHGAIAVGIRGARLSVDTPVPATVIWRGRTYQVGPGHHELCYNNKVI